MIQRIQSLYLFLIAIIAIVAVFVPVAQLYALNADYFLQGVKEVTEGNILYSTIPALVLDILVAVLAVITLLLFKKRKLQVKLCVALFILNLLLILLLLFIYPQFVFEGVFGEDLGISYGYGLVLPFVNFFLISLATKGIKKDEALIRSMDRIR